MSVFKFQTRSAVAGFLHIFFKTTEPNKTFYVFVRKYTDVNEHERLFNITLRHRLK